MTRSTVSLAPRPQRSAIEPPATPDWRRIAQALVLVVATFLCYAPSLRGGFLWDDDAVLVDNPLIKSAAGLWRIWFSTIPLDYYPINYTSFWLEWHLWGVDPLGYRIDNLVLHIGSALIFWRLLAVWRLPGAWCAALLFALHPLNVASVAWISERKNVLSMVFYLTSLHCWARAEETVASSRRRLLYWAAWFAFALALGSKSSVVMLPCVLLLLVWWRRGQVRRPDILRTLPFFGLSLAAGLVSLWFQHRLMMPEDVASALPLTARGVLLGKSIWFYLAKAWLPHPLVMIYPRWRLVPVSTADFLPLGWLLLLCACVGWLTVRRGWRGPAVALAYFCLSLLPVAGLFHMTFYAVSYVSDHLVYVALLSMCALCAAGLAALSERPGVRVAMRMATVSIVAGCGLLTWQRAADFGSAERLWRKTVAINQGSGAAQNNYGLALAERGQTRAAEACFRTALRLDPTLPAALTSFAVLLRREQRWPEASEAYRRLLASRGVPEDYNNYGVVLLYLGDSAAAAVQFKQALSRDPSLYSAHYNLYKLARSAGDRVAVASELEACRQLQPGNATMPVAAATSGYSGL